MPKPSRFKDYGDCPAPTQPVHVPLYGDTDESDRDAETEHRLQQKLQEEQEVLKDMRILHRR